MEVTKEDFEAYKEVQESGHINMFDVKTVSRLADISEDKVFYIMNNYHNLTAEFLPTIEA